MTPLWFAWLGIFFQQTSHRHDETGSAESALRSVASDHRFLNAVKIVFLSEALNSHNVATVELEYERDAGIDGGVFERW